MRKIAMLLVLVGLMDVASANVELKDSLFSDFSRVQDYCNSSLAYDLNTEFEIVSAAYHDRMQCVFSSAASGWIEKESDIFEISIDAIESDFELETISGAQRSCETSFSTVKSLQSEAGHKSLCAASGINAAKDNSLCRVAETAFNEFCAYQEYVYFKTRTAILRESCTTDSLLPGRDDCAVMKAAMEADLDLSKKTLELSLKKYEDFTESWALHGWFSVFAETLENTYRRLTLARIAIAKWPLKFHDAASQKAGSLNAE